MGLIGLLAKVVRIQPSSKALLLVTFDDFVLNIDVEMLIQVIKNHSCEQARDTGADDGNLERLDAVIFASPWRLEALYYRGEFVAAFCIWLDQVSSDFVRAVVGTCTNAEMPWWISLSWSRIAMLAKRAPRSTLLELFLAYLDMVSCMGK